MKKIFYASLIVFLTACSVNATEADKANELRSVPHIMACQTPEYISNKLATEFDEHPVLSGDGIVKGTKGNILQVRVIMYVNAKDMSSFTITVSDGDMECVQSTGANIVKASKARSL
jgi:hypothetical protein